MMVGVRSTEGGWTDNAIRYNGLASRTELVDSAGTTRYTWDGIRVLKTEDDEGTLRQRQVHGYAPIPSVGDMALIESAEGDPYVPDADQVGTIWNLLDSAAAKANAYSYDAFGVGRSASETFANPYRFAGKPLDSDPALYHFIARQYMPRLGRFTKRDIAYAAETCSPRYVYAEQRPEVVLDPTGLWTEIRRQGSARAETCAQVNRDSINTLAAMARMDSEEAFGPDGWLREADGSPVTDADEVVAGQWYSVRNLALIAVGYGGLCTHWFALWQNKLTAALERRGFQVAVFRSDVGGAPQARVQFERRVMFGNEVWGALLFGHGYKKIISWLNWSADEEFADLNGGMAWDRKKYQVTHPSSTDVHHRLALLVAYFCYADLAPWDTWVSPSGKYYGATGLSSCMAGPRAVGWWGSWDSLVGTAAD